MKLRVLAGLVLALSSLLISGCQTKVGAAAVVNGSRISESELASYVSPQAAPFQVSGQTGNQTIVPKSYVLQQLILTRVVENILRHNGGPATDKETAAARTAQLANSSEAQITDALVKRGFKAKFEPALLHTSVLTSILQTRISDQQALQKAVTGDHTRVSVSGRYGAWDSSRLTLSDNPPTPDFIKTSPTPSASPAG